MLDAGQPFTIVTTTDLSEDAGLPRGRFEYAAYVEAIGPGVEKQVGARRELRARRGHDPINMTITVGRRAAGQPRPGPVGRLQAGRAADPPLNAQASSPTSRPSWKDRYCGSADQHGTDHRPHPAAERGAACPRPWSGRLSSGRPPPGEVDLAAGAGVLRELVTLVDNGQATGGAVDGQPATATVCTFEEQAARDWRSRAADAWCPSLIRASRHAVRLMSERGPACWVRRSRSCSSTVSGEGRTWYERHSSSVQRWNWVSARCSWPVSR